ncbi:TetR/AcrR family transcriptional regulator [Oerskovia enterophila]|uniref:TetR/AcrR family transcriptional regulator n=1 Tax=Oerskovia enterophila TaxID=43678 RepID=UPI003808CD59
MDPRIERTTAALRTAVLELATEHDIDDVTVSQVAARAGINRATFYDHASSPADLLTGILRTELDAIRDELFAAVGVTPDGGAAQEGGPGPGAPRAGTETSTATATPPDPRRVVDSITRSVAGHVDAHADIYERARDGGLSAPLFRLLAEHFTETLRAFLVSHPHLMPVAHDAGPTDVEQAAHAYACYVGLGSVGALEAWLATPVPRDPEFFPRIARTSLASWWTAPN